MSENSLEKMLSILDIFESDQMQWEPEDIGARLGLTRSTLYRYLKILIGRGYLVSSSGNGYALGPKISSLEYRLRISDPLIVAGSPMAEELVRHFDGAALICRVFREGFICIYRSQSLKDTRKYFHRGQLMPLVRGANARIIQAHLSRHRLERLFNVNRDEFTELGLGPEFSNLQNALRPIRRDGVCFVDSELRSNIVGVAAPIFDSSGNILGSFSFTILKALLQDGQLASIIDRVKFIANALNHRTMQTSKSS